MNCSRHNNYEQEKENTSKVKEKKEKTFKFRINNRDVFIKGVNWIPADSFLNRVNKSKYEGFNEYSNYYTIIIYFTIY